MKKILLPLLLFLSLTQPAAAQNHVGFNKIFSFYDDNTLRSTCLISRIIYDSVSNKVYMSLQSTPLPVPFTRWREEATLVRTDPNGNIELMKIDTTLNTSAAYLALVQSTDAEYLYWGGYSVEHIDTLRQKMRLTKTDKNLNIIWQKDYPTQTISGSITYICTIPNSTDILVLSNRFTESDNAYNLPAVPAYFYLDRIDSSGTILQTFNPGPTNYNNGINLAIMDNGNYMVSGRTFSWGVSKKGYSLISDTMGTMLSHQLYGLDINSMWMNDMKRAQSTSEYYYNAGMLCYHEDYQDCPAFVNKIDATGVEIWQKRIQQPKSKSSEIKRLATLNNGGVLLAGAARDSILLSDKGWMVQLDSMGNERFNQLYSGLACPPDMHQYLYSVVALPDGSFIAGGSSFIVDPNNPSVNNQKAWLIRIDSAGCTTPNCIGDITSIQAPQLEDANAVQLYPNPAHTQTTIRYARGFAKGAYIKILDALGKLVQSLQLPEAQQEYTIDLSNLTPQLYVLLVLP
jgi:hypothetical protein